ncbi:MAG: GIN domain-containing protein [Gammaproteobacteria bacterium]
MRLHLINLFDTNVFNGNLRISVSHSFAPRLPLMILVSTPNVDRIILRGSGDIDMESIDNERLNLVVEGSGGITARGNSDLLVLRLDGSGDFYLKNLKANRAKVELNGSGDIEVNVSGALDVKINGAGDVYNYGEATRVTKAISGAGEFIQE